jgi:hypothetical protein
MSLKPKEGPGRPGNAGARPGTTSRDHTLPDR